MISSILPAVHDRLALIVGHENFSTSSSTRERLRRTTLPDGTEPLGSVRPSTRAEVQEVVRLARSHAIPLYPVSTGRNWGYGDVCAPKNGFLILDLSRMNRILEVNEQLAYAVVEPGVSQAQLASYLNENGIPLMLDGNGAGPEGGLIGNTLERGFGHSRYGHRFAHCCAMEVVLPDGSVLTTGFGAYPGAKAAHVYKDGIGPSLDGIFTQSNFGIVTRMTIWLMPKPEKFSCFFVTFRDPNSIEPFVDTLRKLRLQGTLCSTIHCFNDRRLLASAARFPWDAADGRTALEVGRPELLRELYRKYRVAAWTASGSLTGSPEEVRGAWRVVRRAIRTVPGLEKLVLISGRHYAWSERIASFLRRQWPAHPAVRLLDNLRLGFDLLAGEPSYQTLKGAHWRARQDPGPRLDPLESGSGLIWVSPVLPMSGAAVHEVTSLAEPVFHRFGFEYQVTFSCINDRALCGVMSICFDHTSEDETRRARSCEKELLAVLLDHGYVPYRGSPAAQQAVRAAAPAYWSAVAALKTAWDPAGVLSPDHYVA